MAKTEISWVEYSINPLRAGKGKSWPSGTHCTKISPGCAYCFAEPLNIRFGNGLPYDNRKTEFHLDLSVFDTLPKTKSCSVFVQSMGDLFHEDVPFGFIDQIMYKIWEFRLRKILILTKRIERASRYFANFKIPMENGQFPKDFNHLWLGVSCENQEMADKRIPILLQIPAAKRFISFEPLLGDIDFGDYVITPIEGTSTDGEKIRINNSLHWVIVGGESGHSARPLHPDWVRSIRDQCKDAGIPFFFKQWGEWCHWEPGKHGKILHISARDGKTGVDPGYVEVGNDYKIRPDTTPIVRVGKKIAGNLLDGVKHEEYPV